MCVCVCVSVSVCSVCMNNCVMLSVCVLVSLKISLRAMRLTAVVV